MLIEELLGDSKTAAKKIKQFEKKEIRTIKDLLRYEPAGYIDCRKITAVSEAVSGTQIAAKVKIKEVRMKKGQKVSYVDALCCDDTGNVTVRFFNTYVYEKLMLFKRKEMLIAGVVEIDTWGVTICNPVIVEEYTDKSLGIYPVYKKVQGMSTEYYVNTLNTCMTIYKADYEKEYKKEDILPERFKEEFDVIDEYEYIMKMHYPKDESDLKAVSRRGITEKMYPLAKEIAYNEMDSKKTSEYIIKETEIYKEMVKLLPYELTEDQKKVISEMLKKITKGERVSTLVQGDVGSGKTIVAIIMSMLMAANGYQSVIMAPTGVLANQHYTEATEYAKRLGIKTGFLASDTKAAERREILKGLQDGSIKILIGTHSVISETVEYANLGMIIVDEEHKFGVEQRERLRERSKEGVHYLAMSATPIPRTLATTLYGNSMDVYNIESMPNGRKPVMTEIVGSFKPMYDFMELEIKKGHQAYIVCPLIENKTQNEDKPYSVEDMERITKNYYKGKGIRVSTITGRTSIKEKEKIIKEFAEGDTDILIATTIIEVGVNVPNATVISIINAERFGLSGLHQLRGRVGRSSLQSYCMLVSNKKDNPRLEIMCKTTNGFKIAEEDLNLRGTGDIIGTKQSGADEKLELMLRYPKFFCKIKEWIKKNA